MNIEKDSRIVEVFSQDLFNKKKDVNELKDANSYIQEIAHKASPETRHEIAQILSYVIDDGITARLDYLEQIADVKQTVIGEKAKFDIEIDGLKAMFQAKSATTERSKVSQKSVFLDTEEVSIRPVVNFLDLKTGKIDLTRIADQAVDKMELAIVKRIQDSVYAAFKAMGNGVNYNTGSGITKGAFDPILFAMSRVGGGATILGDIEAVSGFTELAGFNSNVPDALAIEHNQNGLIGAYRGAKIAQLNNPFQSNSLTDTELRKYLIYVNPSGDAALRPVKVQLEGDVQAMEATSIDSKETEFRFDKYVGVGVVGARKLMGVYEDSNLS